MKIIITLLLITIGIGGFAATQLSKPSAQQETRTFTVTRTDLSTELLLSGSVINEQVVTMTALLDGQLLNMDANEGDNVKADSILARIDDRLSNARLAKSEAAELAAEHLLEASRQNLARTQRLFNTGNSSDQLLQDASFEVQRLEAELDARRADTRIARLNAENTVIRSPFDALVIESSAGVGQWVEAGTQLFKLAANDGVVIEAFVNEADLVRVSLGQAVLLTSNAWADQQWESAVAWIAPAISEDEDAPPDSFAIRLPLGDNAPELLLGQDIDVTLQLTQRDNTLSLPLAAVVEADDGSFYVWREKDDGVVKQPITTGLSTSDSIEIVEGLAENDVVLAAKDAEQLARNSQ